MAESGRRDLDLPEVDESKASEDVSGIYERIKESLQTSVVGSAWKAFATKPQFLQSIWSELEPAIDQGFIEAADAVRAVALQRVREGEKVPDHTSFLGDNLAKAVEELRVFLQANPKDLILICALRHAWHGEEIQGVRKPASADRGVPRWQPAPELGSDGAVKDVFGEIVELLDVPQPTADYRALAKWPDYLNSAWADLRSFIGTDTWQKIATSVDWVAEQAAIALPARISISPERADELGLEKEEIDEVGEWIEAFHATLPGLIVNTSYLWLGLFGGTQELPAPAPTGAPREEKVGPTVEGAPEGSAPEASEAARPGTVTEDLRGTQDATPAKTAPDEERGAPGPG